MSKKVIMHFDGACTDNKRDGDLGLGTYAYYEGEETNIFEIASYGGIGTSNEAEYLALQLGINNLIKHSLTENPILIKGDSQLIIKQITGEFQTKDFRMFQLRNTLLSTLTDKFTNVVDFELVPREENSYADMLSNKGTKRTLRNYYKTKTW